MVGMYCILNHKGTMFSGKKHKTLEMAPRVSARCTIKEIIQLSNMAICKKLPAYLDNILTVSTGPTEQFLLTFMCALFMKQNCENLTCLHTYMLI